MDEHFRIVGRTKFYESIGEMQVDLDGYLKIYNQERAHQGRNMNGRTPYQAFIDGLLVEEKEAGRFHVRSRALWPPLDKAVDDTDRYIQESLAEN